jgi:hypothetical protein
MKDDNLSDVQKELNPVNCPHGIAMDIYCKECVKYRIKYDDSFPKDGAKIASANVGTKYINSQHSRQGNTYATEIWNAAIEAAINLVGPEDKENLKGLKK